jgi:hypothetical protein
LCPRSATSSDPRPHDTGVTCLRSNVGRRGERAQRVGGLWGLNK